MLATPNTKRGRGQAKDSPRTPFRAGRRIQTPIQNFLVLKTPAERWQIIQHSWNRNPDMSASPCLKKMSKRQSGGQKTSSGRRNTTQWNLGAVAKIMEYFETPGKSPQAREQPKARMV